MIWFLSEMMMIIPTELLIILISLVSAVGGMHNRTGRSSSEIHEMYMHQPEKINVEYTTAWNHHTRSLRYLNSVRIRENQHYFITNWRPILERALPIRGGNRVWTERMRMKRSMHRQSVDMMSALVILPRIPWNAKWNWKLCFAFRC